MDTAQRESILNNIDELIANTEYKELMAHCIKHGLITKEAKENIEVSADKPQRWYAY